MGKRGFTLIELLAVIVVLAVIAVIAIPIITGVIDKAKKGAVKDSVYGIESAASIYYAKNMEEEITGIYNLSEGKIEYKGEID